MSTANRDAFPTLLSQWWHGFRNKSKLISRERMQPALNYKPSKIAGLSYVGGQRATKGMGGAPAGCRSGHPPDTTSNGAALDCPRNACGSPIRHIATTHRHGRMLGWGIKQKHHHQEPHANRIYNQHRGWRLHVCDATDDYDCVTISIILMIMSMVVVSIDTLVLKLRHKAVFRCGSRLQNCIRKARARGSRHGMMTTSQTTRRQCRQSGALCIHVCAQQARAPVATIIFVCVRYILIIS